MAKHLLRWMLRPRGHDIGTRGAHGNHCVKMGVLFKYMDWHDIVDEHWTGKCWSCKEDAMTVMSDRALKSHVSTLML